MRVPQLFSLIFSPCVITCFHFSQFTAEKKWPRLVQTTQPNTFVKKILKMSPKNDATITTTTPTMKKHLPLLPIPDPICSDIPGTWAYDTMSRRVNDEIMQRTADDCSEYFESEEFQEINDRFKLLRQELSNAGSTKLSHLQKPIDYDTNIERKKEWDEWFTIMDPLVSNNDTWLTAPWLLTEFYAYRRLMDAIGYWSQSTLGYKFDPFVKSKRAGLHSSIGSAEPMLGRVPNLPSDAAGLGIATNIALWGNKMDLSLWPADAMATDIDIFSDILDKAQENLLHDDSTVLAEYCTKLREAGGGNIDIIIDNAGFELITDLALGQYLIQSGIAKVVTFQMKSHPTFVSDALEKDLIETIDYYSNLDREKYPNNVASAETWRKLIQNEQWKCNENNFWVQPFAMWDMTEPLRTDLQERCDLAFVKGDANYRRLLGDRTWDYTLPFQNVVGCYFACPVCALRTLKAELGVGMDKEQVVRASELDANWMTNGRFGVIHFGTGVPK